MDAARDQLENMQKAKNKPHVLDDQLVAQIIKSYTKQNKSIADEKALCIHCVAQYIYECGQNVLENFEDDWDWSLALGELEKWIRNEKKVLC